MTRITRILEPRSTRRPVATRLRAAAAVGALVLIGGVAHASIGTLPEAPPAATQDARQEYDALQQRLRGLVKQGWMTEEEMKRVLETVARRMKANEAAGKGDNASPDFDAFAKQVKLAVGSGWMTKDEAERTLAAAKERMARAKNTNDESTAEERIRRAVAEGRLTKEEAVRKLDEVRRTEVQRRRTEVSKEADAVVQLRKKLAAVEKELAAGRISAEEAKRALQEIRKRLEAIDGAQEKRPDALPEKEKRRDGKGEPKATEAPQKKK